MKVKEVFLKNVDNQTFYYLHVGRGYRFKPCYTIWVHKNFVNEWQDTNWSHKVETYRNITFPISKCDIKIGKNEKNLIVKSGEKNLFYFEIRGGVKGSSWINEIVSDDSNMTVFYFKNCHTEKCYNADAGVLILTSAEKVKIRWYRKGKLLGKYDFPKGITILYKDGKEETVTEETVTEELNEIQKELE